MVGLKARLLTRCFRHFKGTEELLPTQTLGFLTFKTIIMCPVSLKLRRLPFFVIILSLAVASDLGSAPVEQTCFDWRVG